MTPLVVGIDSGGTATKVAVIDAAGAIVAVGVERAAPQPRSGGRAERDPDQHWHSVAALVRRTLSRAAISPARIAAVGVAAQGDGLLLVDGSGRPTGPAILSSDVRAAPVLERWTADGTLDSVVGVIGHRPLPGSPGALLAWTAEHEPDRLRDAEWALAGKDWLRFRLTGAIATDRTDAGAGFVDIRSQEYSPIAVELYGANLRRRVVPGIMEPTDIAGRVTAEAASATGLASGTPVVIGLHDVLASVLGSTGVAPGRASLIVGTFGVNVVLTSTFTPEPGINYRPGLLPGSWAPRRTSRVSAGNLDWMAGLMPVVGEVDERVDLERVLDAPTAEDAPLYLPFLLGGEHDQPESASLLGLRPWHTRDDVLRAVVEGVVFNHRADLERLSATVPVGSVHVSGGVTASGAWVQVIADVLGRSVTTAFGDVAGARGAAMCAAVGVGMHPDLATGADRMRPAVSEVRPGGSAAPRQAAYVRFRREVDRMARVLRAPASVVAG